jgi:hypothetical protein
MASDGKRDEQLEGPFPETGVPAVAIREEHGAAKDKKKRKKEKKLRVNADKAVDSLFRISYRTHTDLSAQADRKASILLSINGLIISISLASFTRNYQANPWLLLPAGVLLIGCVTSLTYAVLTARPRVTRNMITLDQVRNQGANILFFGNYVSLSETEYQAGIGELMRDPERLYQIMSRDLYALGNVLQRKFAMLWIAYTVLMVSVGASVLLYLAVYIRDALTR